MASPDGKKELPPAQKFKRADINVSFRSMFGIEGEKEEPEEVGQPNEQEVGKEKEKMVHLNIIESPPITTFTGAPRTLPSISKRDLSSETSASSLTPEDAISPPVTPKKELTEAELEVQRMGSSSKRGGGGTPVQEGSGSRRGTSDGDGREEVTVDVPAVTLTPVTSSTAKKVQLAYPIEQPLQGQDPLSEESPPTPKPKEGFAKSIISRTRAYSQSIMLLTKGKRRSTDSEGGDNSPTLAKPLINPRVSEITGNTSGRPKSNSLKMLQATNATTNVSDKFRAWQRKSMMEQMEGSQIMKDKKYKLLVEQQHQRVLTEVPRAVQLEIIEQAYPIVLKVCHHYIKHLGEKHEITQKAINRLSSMAAELERECEYTPINPDE